MGERGGGGGVGGERWVNERGRGAGKWEGRGVSGRE